MFVFPNLDNSTVFPIPEGSNLEFKSGYHSSCSEKIYSTICGILNCGGGYLVIGVEDGSRKILGILQDKNLDKFLLMIDGIYHLGMIKKKSGLPISVGTIKTGIVNAANDKKLAVVTITPEEMKLIL